MYRIKDYFVMDRNPDGIGGCATFGIKMFDFECMHVCVCVCVCVCVSMKDQYIDR